MSSLPGLPGSLGLPLSGDSGNSDASFDVPVGSLTLLIGDALYSDQVIRSVDSSGIINILAITGADGPWNPGIFSPRCMNKDAAGNVYVADDGWDGAGPLWPGGVNSYAVWQLAPPNYTTAVCVAGNGDLPVFDDFGHSNFVDGSAATG